LTHHVKALEEDCRESRMRENRTYGLTRGSRDLFSVSLLYCLWYALQAYVKIYNLIVCKGYTDQLAVQSEAALMYREGMNYAEFKVSVHVSRSASEPS